MPRNPSESQEHRALITMMANHFKNEGFRNIRADIPSFPDPAVIHGTKKNHLPDLTANNNGTDIILEAETSGSIFDDHTVSQWTLFADAAQRYGGEFHVVVPKGSRSAAEQRAASLGIQLDNLWTPK
jgi:hypothetical protein